MKLKYLVIVIFLIAVVAVYASIKAGAPRKVDAARVTRGDIAEFVDERGRTRYDVEYTVSVLVSGYVPPIGIEEGAIVKKGQILAEVEDVPYSVAIAEAQDEINRIKAMMESVDVAKPKPEEIENAKRAVDIAELMLKATNETITSLENAAETAKWAYEKDRELFDNKIISEAQFREKKDVYLSAEAALEQRRKMAEIEKLQVDTAKSSLALVTDYIDDNEYQREAYKAQVSAIENRLKKLRDDLRKTSIVSPIDGILLRRHSRGSVVMAAGMPLFQVGDPSSIELNVELLTDDVTRVEPGQKIILSGEVLGGKKTEGKVERILPTGFLKRSTLGVEQERVGVICSFDNSGLELGPVYGVDVRIITNEKENVLRVPERAVFKSDGKHRAFVVREGKAVLVDIEVGLEGEDAYEVLSGLSEDDVVIVAPPADLEEGMEVEPNGS